MNFSIGISAAVLRAEHTGEPFATKKVDMLGKQNLTYKISAPSRTVSRALYSAINFSVLLRRTFIDSIYV
jgi:hypothetical protein